MSAAKKFKTLDDEPNMSISFAKLSSRARTPLRASAKSAGYDLFAADGAVIAAGARACIATDIQIAIPEGCYGRIAPRSGLAAKYGLDVGAGVVDADFRGNVKVLLFNFGDEPFEVNPGDRIAQIIMEKILNAEIVEVASLDATDRGEGGFGSSGIV